MTEITRFHVPGRAESAVTAAIAWQPGAGWPLLLACRRMETPETAPGAPGRHWQDREEVVGLQDGMGSRLAVNDDGVVALLLGDPTGPGPDRRDRDELALEAVDHADAVAAAEALSALDGRAYDPFVLMVADNRDAYVFRHEGGPDRAAVRVRPMTAGLHVLTVGPPPAAGSGAVLPPVPDPLDLAAWAPAMADWQDALTGPAGPAGQATSLIALPAAARAAARSIWLFSPGMAAFGQFQPMERD
ncbi:MAG: NRDE family protein [Inquilinaceae bacterium]